MIEVALRSYLLTRPDITAIVGQRIYDGTPPQKADYPRVTIQTASNVTDYHMQGAAGTVTNRVQVDIWHRARAGGKSTVRAMREAIRNAVSGYRGLMGSVDVRSCFLDNVQDQDEPAKDATDMPLCRVTMDLQITYVESAPTL